MYCILLLQNGYLKESFILHLSLLTHCLHDTRKASSILCHVAVDDVNFGFAKQRFYIELADKDHASQLMASALHDHEPTA